MKVRMTRKSKEIFTVAEMPLVRKIMENMKDDDTSVMELAQITMSLISFYMSKELKDKGFLSVFQNDWKLYDECAEMCKNIRVSDYFAENSGHMDVWITWLAVNQWYGAIECGICMTDALSINCHEIDCEENAEIYKHLYIYEYKPLKAQA